MNPWYGDRITCICAKDSDGNRFSCVNDDEDMIIGEFYKWLCHLRFYSKIDDYFLVSKNGKQFDIPFILTRECWLLLNTDWIMDEDDSFALINCRHFDLQEITDKRISLNDMAKLLGCKLKSGKGKDAINLWENGEYGRLKEYCMNDVDVTEEVYLKYMELQEVNYNRK